MVARTRRRTPKRAVPLTKLRKAGGEEWELRTGWQRLELAVSEADCAVLLAWSLRTFKATRLTKLTRPLTAKDEAKLAGCVIHKEQHGPCARLLPRLASLREKDATKAERAALAAYVDAVVAAFPGLQRADFQQHLEVVLRLPGGPCQFMHGDGEQDNIAFIGTVQANTPATQFLDASELPTVGTRLTRSWRDKRREAKLGAAGRAVLEQHAAAQPRPKLATPDPLATGSGIAFRTRHWHRGPACERLSVVLFLAATGSRDRAHGANDTPVFAVPQTDLPPTEDRSKRGRPRGLGGSGCCRRKLVHPVHPD